MSDYRRTIAVTGGAGFIGSNLLRRLVKAASDCRFVCLDALTYAGNPANLTDLENEPNYGFEQIDLCDHDGLKACFEKYRFDGVFNLAAESHVDRSISGPSPFLDTNIVGTFNLLELIRSAQEQGKQGRLLHVSTDEVYGSIESGQFDESSPYHPNSPYAATKAAADHLVRSYVNTYGLDCVITNCSNNHGPYQHPEKFIPTVIRHAVAGEPIPVYGDGQNVRDWIHVFDHCMALDLVFEKGESGATYNVGSRCEQKNLDLAVTICRIVDDLLGDGKREELIKLVDDRPGHDQRYAIDPSKIESTLSWAPQTNFMIGLTQTIEWYLSHQDWIGNTLERTERMKGQS